MTDMQNIFDSHAHYDDPRFDPDRDEVIALLKKNGVVGVLNAGCDIETSYRTLSLARKHNLFWAACGIQPEFAGEYPLPADGQDGWLSELEAMLYDERVVAVGEIGLDYHYEDGPPREMQIAVFEEQLRLAKKMALPVVIHSRDATADTFNILYRHRPRGVLHCFSGSVETMREAVDLGLYIGLTGVVTFSNARKAKEVAAAVPIDRLLLETDCPYMAPVPFRGQRSTSDMIACTASVIAELRGISPQKLLDQTRENVRALYGI